VQLSEACDKARERRRECAGEVRARDEGVPLVREGRRARGTGLLDEAGALWLQAASSDQCQGNPVFYKCQQAGGGGARAARAERRAEREVVGMLPDIVGELGARLRAEMGNLKFLSIFFVYFLCQLITSS